MQLNEVLTSKKASIHNYFDSNLKKKYYELEILTNKDLERVIKFINNNTDKYKFWWAKLEIEYKDYLKNSIKYATKKYRSFYKVVNFETLCKIFRKKEKWAKKKIYIYLYENKTVFQKSPVIYPYKKKYKSDCKSGNCISKYWPNWCWYNSEASSKIKLDKNYNWYWFHDRKVPKKIEYKIVQWKNESYVFIYWHSYSEDVLTTSEAKKKWIKVIMKEDAMWNVVYVCTLKNFENKVKPFLEKINYKIIKWSN